MMQINLISAATCSNLLLQVWQKQIQTEVSSKMLINYPVIYDIAELIFMASGVLLLCFSCISSDVCV